MTPMDYKWVNSHSKVQPCTLTSISLNPCPLLRRWWSQDLCIYYFFFFCLECSTPTHPRLCDQLIQIHHSCLSYNIISSENPPLPPSCELSYCQNPYSQVIVNIIHSTISFRDPAQLVIMSLLVYSMSILFQIIDCKRIRNVSIVLTAISLMSWKPGMLGKYLLNK